MATPTPGGGEKTFKPMPKKQIAYFEKRLLEERRRVVKELGHYDETFGSSPQGADGDLSSYSFHMADQGTDAMEREKAALFASQEGRFLWHIDQALRRLYRTPETYGMCHQCKGEIHFARYEDIDAAIRPLYTEAGFSVRFRLAPPHKEGWVRVILKVSHSGHFEESEVELPPDSGPGRNGLQAIGSAQSYAERYLLKGAFALVMIGEDNDGRSADAYLNEEQINNIQTLIEKNGIVPSHAAYRSEEHTS